MSQGLVSKIKQVLQSKIKKKTEQSSAAGNKNNERHVYRVPDKSQFIT